MRKFKPLFIILFIFCVVGYLAVIIFRIYSEVESDKFFHSSPTDSRNVPLFVDDSSLGLLEPDERKLWEGRRADVAFTVPKYIKGSDDDFVLDWGKEPDEVAAKETTLPDHWVNALQGDDQLDLVAFASWVPGANDPIDDPDWQADIDFYDATTLAKLSTEDLDQLGIPSEYRKLTPPKKYPIPKIRLLFQSKGMEYVCFTRVEGADMRTESVVTYDLDHLNEEEPAFAQIGEWCRLDAALLVWHDTPLKFYIQALTGEPQIRELKQELGEQVVFDDYLRVQWLTQFQADNLSKENLSSFVPATSTPDASSKAVSTSIAEYKASSEFAVRQKCEIDRDSAPGVTLASTPWHTLLRVSSRRFQAEQCGWLKPEGGVEWEWEYETGEEGVDLVSIPHRVDLSKPVRLVSLPNVTEFTVELKGLPSAPNPRSTSNLFDVVIPRLTLDSRWGKAENDLIALLSVAAEVDWDLDDLWDSLPSNFPEDRTFRNKTPNELMNWYLNNTPNSSVTYEPADRKIYFNEDAAESWFAKFWQSIRSRFP